MRYLVTGGAGFIPTHLAHHLVTLGHSVTTLDLRRAPTMSGVRHVLGDVTDAPTVERLVAQHEATFHLASVVGFANVMHDPVRTITTSNVGTHNVLRASAREGKRVLFTSTSAVYGRTTDDQRPVVETDHVRLGPPTVRSWCYAYAKAADECLAMAYQQERLLPVIVTRLFNTVGPGQSADAGFVLPQFIQAAKAGQPLEVHAPGTQSRTFAHVQDVVEGLATLMTCDAAVGEIVNLGGTATITMVELAARVCAVLDSPSAIRLVPDPYGKGYENVAHRVPCLDKAKRLIGYTPMRDLDTMIRDVAQLVPA